MDTRPASNSRAPSQVCDLRAHEDISIERIA